MLFFSICVFSFIMSRIGVSGTVDMTPFRREMTVGLYVSLTNETSEYKPSSIESMMNNTRRQILGIFRSVPYGYWRDKMYNCYMTLVTYKAAIWDLQRYFHVRTMYMNTVEFEIGYLTHEIIYRYQLILELYNMVERRFINKEHTNLAPISYMLYVYTNILVHSKAIMHLVNMMHEIEKKYLNQKKGVFDDYGDKAPGRGNKTLMDVEDELKLFMEKQRKEEKKRAKEHKNYLKQLKKYGLTPGEGGVLGATKWRKPKKGPFPLVYGWSLENW